MNGILFVFLGALTLSQDSNYLGENETYFDFPKFWTYSGLCPAGSVTHQSIKESLMSDAMQMNILLISALPQGALTHLRIHWVLELLEFEQYTQSGLPIYDFQDLDIFLQNLNAISLHPVIEFMANLSSIFTKNPNYNNVMWEDLSYQVAKRYLTKTFINWRFETWNEPDVSTYNKLNFTLDDYIHYALSIQNGLRRAGNRSDGSLHFPLRGPAGLFKSFSHHLLCWGLLEYCNTNILQCPIDIITYHRKGNGTEINVLMNESHTLLLKMYAHFPFLRHLPISNDEADPISGWSIPRSFQEDVRYAVAIINIVLQHWIAKLKSSDFKKLESISHDNAFLSYHPFEFSQRTLLAHFRMNITNPPHSQFIQKPVYAALGILSRLADRATDVLQYDSARGNRLIILKTTSIYGLATHMSWLILPLDQDAWSCQNEMCNDSILLPKMHFCNKDVHAFIVEYIDQKNTNPARNWREFGSPAFPNATERKVMRKHQTPRILAMGILEYNKINIDFKQITPPWVLLLRICSNFYGHLNRPKNLQITPVTHNEVQLTWTESASPSKCLRTYEIWFKNNTTLKWRDISHNYHIPFPSFQYAPDDGTNVNGYYKVRGVDVFNSSSRFSTQIQYTEV